MNDGTAREGHHQNIEYLLNLDKRAAAVSKSGNRSFGSRSELILLYGTKVMTVRGSYRSTEMVV